jgi:hypothetical protein
MSFSADERAARRSVRLLGAGVLAIMVGAAVTITFRILDHGPPPARGRVVEPSASPFAPETGHTGPVPGDEVASYLAGRQSQLEQATGEQVAVVSLKVYVTEAAARRAGGDLRILALLAAAPGGSPSTVTGTMDQWAAAQRRSDTEERDEFRKLIPTTDDPAFKADYQSEVQRLDKAIAAIDPKGEVVFGLVVRAPADQLRKLAKVEGVRVVDTVSDGAASGAKGTDATAYSGIRPEEKTKIGDPKTRPVT